MDAKYLQLFAELANTSEILAEQVMEKDHQDGNEAGEKTAQFMRDDYRGLKDRVAQGPDALEKKDYTRLMAGALIVANNIADRIKAYQVAYQGYKTDLLPKLQRILEETKTDEEAKNLAEQLFTIKDET